MLWENFERHRNNISKQWTEEKQVTELKQRNNNYT